MKPYWSDGTVSLYHGDLPCHLRRDLSIATSPIIQRADALIHGVTLGNNYGVKCSAPRDSGDDTPQVITWSIFAGTEASNQVSVLSLHAQVRSQHRCRLRRHLAADHPVVDRLPVARVLTTAQVNLAAECFLKQVDCLWSRLPATNDFGVGKTVLIRSGSSLALDRKPGASRFYPTFRYQAKAPAAERPRGEDGNAHPTVKSLSLMRYFTRLITPPGGTILDLFAGSGPVAEAAIVEGFKCILIEKDPASAELIRVRLSKDIQPVMFGEIA